MKALNIEHLRVTSINIRVNANSMVEVTIQTIGDESLLDANWELMTNAPTSQQTEK